MLLHQDGMVTIQDDRRNRSPSYCFLWGPVVMLMLLLLMVHKRFDSDGMDERHGRYSVDPGYVVVVVVVVVMVIVQCLSGYRHG